MKTYICTGIGDMMSLDTVMSPEEKESISEIYWACRFGKNLIPLFENNPEYPNLKKHHVIDDEVGKQAMASLDPVAIPFWHFRPDFPRNLQVGLELFGIQNEEIQLVNAVKRFLDVGRMVRSGEDVNNFYYGSSFIRNSKNPEIGNYILFHYPTSTRPRNDISTIDSFDWYFTHLSIHQKRSLAPFGWEVRLGAWGQILQYNIWPDILAPRRDLCVERFQGHSLTYPTPQG